MRSTLTPTQLFARQYVTPHLLHPQSLTPELARSLLAQHCGEAVRSSVPALAAVPQQNWQGGYIDAASYACFGMLGRLRTPEDVQQYFRSWGDGALAHEINRGIQHITNDRAAGRRHYPCKTAEWEQQALTTAQDLGAGRMLRAPRFTVGTAQAQRAGALLMLLAPVPAYGVDASQILRMTAFVDSSVRIGRVDECDNERLHYFIAGAASHLSYAYSAQEVGARFFKRMYESMATFSLPSLHAVLRNTNFLPALIDTLGEDLVQRRQAGCWSDVFELASCVLMSCVRDESVDRAAALAHIGYELMTRLSMEGSHNGSVMELCGLMGHARAHLPQGMNVEQLRAYGNAADAAIDYTSSAAERETRLQNWLWGAA